MTPFSTLYLIVLISILIIILVSVALAIVADVINAWIREHIPAPWDLLLRSTLAVFGLALVITLAIQAIIWVVTK